MNYSDLAKKYGAQKVKDKSKLTFDQRLSMLGQNEIEWPTGNVSIEDFIRMKVFGGCKVTDPNNEEHCFATNKDANMFRIALLSREMPGVVSDYRLIGSY